MTDSASIRASDAERERVADQLRRHYAEGRLSEEEMSDRLDAAYAATTQGQLGELLVDLPVDRSAVLPSARPAPDSAALTAAREAREHARRRIYQDAGAVVMVNLLCIAVWLASGAHGQFWPIWVLLVSAFRLARDGWRLLGPGGDPRLASRDRHERRRVEREQRRDLALGGYERRRAEREQRRDLRR